MYSVYTRPSFDAYSQGRLTFISRILKNTEVASCRSVDHSTCSALFSLMVSPPGATVAVFCIAVFNMSGAIFASLCRMMEKVGGCQEKI